MFELKIMCSKRESCKNGKSYYNCARCADLSGIGCSKPLYEISRKAKFKAFLKRHKRAVKTILITVLVFISFFVLNGVGEAQRGYKAVGGEVLVFIMPFLIIGARNCIHDLIDLFK